MPKWEIFGPQEGETYEQHLIRLQEAHTRDYTASSKAASLMTLMMMKQFAGKNQPINREQFNKTRHQLEKSKAFQKMMESPGTLGLIQKNETTALFTKMAELETARQQRLDAKYKRPVDKEVVAMDAEFLKTAIDGLKESAGSAPANGSPEIERRGKLYEKMMKQLDHAQSLAEKGIQLTGESTKALVSSIKAYNDGSKKTVDGVKQNVRPGGERKAEGFTQSMALLKHYMPAAKFNQYCEDINKERNITSTQNVDFVAPESFEPAVLQGGKTAKELAARHQHDARTDFSVDRAAEILAIRQLSGGNPNKLITPSELEKKKAKLVEPGTAFMKVMGNEKSREKLRSLAADGNMVDTMAGLSKETAKMEKEMQEQARKTVVRTAQGEINRSIARLTNGNLNNRYFTEQFLANILASEQLAANAKGDEKINNGAFRTRAEDLRQDPAFQRLADRYINDAAYRKRMNDGLLRDRSALSLASELQAERQPIQRQREPVRQQPMQPGFQPMQQAQYQQMNMGQVQYPQQMNMGQVPYPQQMNMQQAQYQQQMNMGQVPYQQQMNMGQVPYQQQMNMAQGQYQQMNMQQMQQGMYQPQQMQQMELGADEPERAPVLEPIPQLP